MNYFHLLNSHFNTSIKAFYNIDTSFHFSTSQLPSEIPWRRAAFYCLRVLTQHLSPHMLFVRSPFPQEVTCFEAFCFQEDLLLLWRGFFVAHVEN